MSWRGDSDGLRIILIVVLRAGNELRIIVVHRRLLEGQYK